MRLPLIVDWRRKTTAASIPSLVPSCNNIAHGPGLCKRTSATMNLGEVLGVVRLRHSCSWNRCRYSGHALSATPFFVPPCCPVHGTSGTSLFISCRAVGNASNFVMIVFELNLAPRGSGASWNGLLGSSSHSELC